MSALVLSASLVALTVFRVMLQAGRRETPWNGDPFNQEVQVPCVVATGHMCLWCLVGGIPFVNDW